MSINQKELIKRIAQKINQKDEIVEEIVNATLEEIYDCLKPTFRTSLCKMIKVLKPSNLFWTKYK